MIILSNKHRNRCKCQLLVSENNTQESSSIMTRLTKSILCMFLMLSLSQFSHAYSYAAAGKEPLLDAWISISELMSNKDYISAAQEISDLNDELVNLESEADLALVWRLKEASQRQDLSATGEVFSSIFIAIIEQRMNLALESLNNYQLAKVHVAKSKRYLDILLNDIDLLGQRLAAPQRTEAKQAIAQCLESLGKPGLFGAGNQPADASSFNHAKTRLMESLRDHP